MYGPSILMDRVTPSGFVSNTFSFGDVFVSAAIAVVTTDIIARLMSVDLILMVSFLGLFLVLCVAWPGAGNLNDDRRVSRASEMWRVYWFCVETAGGKVLECLFFEPSSVTEIPEPGD